MGRIEFSSKDGYRDYIQQLIDYDNSKSVPTSHQAVLWATANQADVATQLSASLLVDPLFAGFDAVVDLKIRQVLEMKAVSERLFQLGVTSDEVQQRLASLSDQQIHQIALQLDDLRIGQTDALGVIIALLVIVILVIVILKLTGHKVLVTK